MRAFCVMLIAVGLSGPVPIYGQNKAPAVPAPAKTFSENDALQVMDGLRKAMESESRGHLLALFDAKRMPEFAVFRDQVAQFFAQYQSFRVNYHVTQTAQDGEFGSIVSEFVIEAQSTSEGLPALRRRAQLHLILAWNGSAWKIADLAPRDVFR